MVLKITQETFNQAVQENMTDLGLSNEEAVTEAVNQFKAQGVDLSNIVTDISAVNEFKDLNNLVTALKAGGEIQSLLNDLKQACDKGIQYRIEAGKNGAYDLLLDLIQNSGTDQKLGALKAVTALMTKQPDLLEERGSKIIINNLHKEIDVEIKKQALKWCRECCVMHEMNRQALMNLNVVEHLSVILQEGNPNILKEALAVFRALILDDDVRVEFGHAHEHARVLAAEGLEHLINLMKTFKSDANIIPDLFLTLSSLLVRAEFCLKVEEFGGLEIINDVLGQFSDNEKVIRQCFKVIKALAGNDTCKVHMIQKGIAPLISNALKTHQKVAQTAVAGLHCVAALSLRSPDNSKALFEAGLPDVLIAVMKLHPDDKSVQKTASWAIRNMVSRSRYQNPHFLELGVEELLQKNLSKFKEFEYDTKAALRDLECNVELKEEWTGKGGRITTETTLKEN